MKKLLLLFLASVAISFSTFAQQVFTITNSGFQYTPATLTITAGDTVQFNQGSSHPAREVSQTTWNANGTTSNGGFDNMHSGSKVKLNTPGTYYYVCVNHVSSAGMKGQIVVQAANSVEEEKLNMEVKAYPSPVVSNLNISIELSKSQDLSVEIFNLIGERVYSKPTTNYSSGKTNLSVDFSEFSNGAYFVKVIGKDEQFSMKIMK